MILINIFNLDMCSNTHPYYILIFILFDCIDIFIIELKHIYRKND